MYRKIRLACDGSREGLIALREGALLSQALQADVLLLAICVDHRGLWVLDGVFPAPEQDELKDLMARGLASLEKLGVSAEGEIVFGEPVVEIAKAAARFGADLIVVGHRRQSLLERWWVGSSGAYLVDQVSCSVLVARHIVSDAQFEDSRRSSAPETFDRDPGPVAAPRWAPNPAGSERPHTWLDLDLITY